MRVGMSVSVQDISVVHERTCKRACKRACTYQFLALRGPAAAVYSAVLQRRLLAQHRPQLPQHLPHTALRARLRARVCQQVPLRDCCENQQ